jgi:hypothetical protein
MAAAGGPAEDGHAGAFRREALGGGEPDAAVAAGDESDLALES